jgi:hypothetical protein
MTDDRELLPVLERWLDEGPTRMSDRVFDTVAGRIARQPQRPAWRLDWRRYTMNPTIKLAAAVLAVVIVAVIGYNLLPGSTGVGGPQPAVTPAATASPTPIAAATPTFNVDGQCGAALSTCRGSLTAGTYTSRAMDPALTFTVPSGWYNKFDQPRGYGLEAGTNTSLEVQRDLVVARADCVEAETEPGVGTTASEMVQALAARPGLDTTEPAPITIGGLSGFTIDITLSPDWTTPCPYSEGRPMVPTVTDPQATPGTGLHWAAEPVTDGSFARYIILDLPGGGTVLIAPGGSPSFVTAAMPVIESFQFAP